MRAVIVGAGIGGLAAAIALRRVGIETVNLERAPAVREVGAALAIWSNGVNALKQLQADTRVIASASVIERSVSQTSAGEPVVDTPIADFSRQAGAPSICVHRAVLQKILFEQLPEGSVRTSARCIGLDGPAAVLDTGERVEGNLLVGADGIFSAVRESLHGSAAPRYAGYTCWRGICADTGALGDGVTLQVTAPGVQFGCWPCGLGRRYWFLTKNGPPGASHSLAEPMSICANWAPPARQIVASTSQDSIIQADIIDRPPLQSWGRGSVTLLGDAAHAATPNLGQGACQALEDAVFLSDCIRRFRPIAAALREYERLRIPRTSAIIRNSWTGGRMMQLEQPALQSIRNWFMGTPLARRLAARTLGQMLAYPIPSLEESGRPPVQVTAYNS